MKTIYILFVVAYFLVIISYQLQIKALKRDNEKKISELQSMISVSNLIEDSEFQYNVYDNAEKFLSYYYGISENISLKFRKQQLEKLMTKDAIQQCDLDCYDNTYGYESTIDNIRIYLDEKNGTNTSVTACIFFDENIKWPSINLITNSKLWIGEFNFDATDKEWKMNKIISYQQVISEEEYNALNLDTNGSEADTNLQEDGDEEE